MKVEIASLRWGDGGGSWWERPAPAPHGPALPGSGRPSPSRATEPPPATVRADPRLVRVRGRLRSGTLALPMVPDVARATRRLADRGDASADAVTALAAEDPALAARFLVVVPGGRAPRSVRAAVDGLESRTVRDVLLRAAHATVPPPARFARDVEASARRARRCVVAAETIAARLGLALEGLELAALLHDVGELRVWRVVADTFPDIARDDARSIVAALHQEAGADLARAWRLPAFIVDTCGAHHALGPQAPLLQRIVAASGAVVDAATGGLTAQRLDELAAAGVGATLARELVARLAPGRARE